MEVGELDHIRGRQIDLYNDAPLDKSPRSNWLERVGGLPPNVRARARAIKRKNPGWSLSRCIATAIAANKHSAKTGGDLFFHDDKKDGPAAYGRHTAADADWERKKAQSKGKRGK